MVNSYLYLKSVTSAMRKFALIQIFEMVEWILFNSIALRKAKIVYNFGLSECNRVKIQGKQLCCSFLARVYEVQEELLFYPGIRVGVCGGGGVSKMLKFLR